MSPIPVDITPPMETANFELINCLKAFDKVPIFEYKSRRTGLSVIVAEVDGPIVNGYFCLATEAFDDDGLPHTLEHLIFLGSEDYPYKGVLDLLANRCLASGTNAWTDTDHTCYTMETAGSDGFLALMPIFLDHILYPKLTDEGFVTEVHHITPQGTNAGVVYCEMQGRENSAESRLHLNLARAMYPGRCGYSSETGGIMKNLRESTNNEKVRNYHHHFYRPENLKIIITGQINHNAIFQSLHKLEEKILMKGGRDDFVRPWQTPVAPLLESRDLIIPYPADEEINGLYCISWRGPSAVHDQYTLTAITLFLTYLTEFSTYTLPKEFVEIDDPYASNVTFNVVENAVTCISIFFQNVPIRKLSEIKPKLQKILKDIGDNGDINMERLENVIQRNKLEQLSNLENSPHSVLAFMIIGQMLYGNTKQEFEQRLNPLIDLDKLSKEPKSYWIDLIDKYLINNHYISIQCIPSKLEHEQMAKDEAERIQKQIDELGDDGLKKCEQILNDAIDYNNREPPIEMLTSVPIPNFNSINFFNITRYRSDLIENDVDQRIDLTNTPVFTYFDDVNSEFVYMYALLDSSAIPEDLRIYLPLILELLFDSPIRRNNEIIPYEEVVEQLKRDTLSSDAFFGVLSKSGLFKCSPYSTTISIMLQLIPENYEKGIEWLNNIIYNIVFTIDRLKIISTKINNAISQIKRSGGSMASYAMRELRFIKNSNLHQNGILLQNRFLIDLQQKLLDENQAIEIVNNCEKIWQILTNPKNIVLHIMGNLNKLEMPEKLIIERFLPENLEKNQHKFEPIPDFQLLKTINDDDDMIKGCFIGMACLESSFFYQTIDSINSYNDPDLPALMLYLQYLIQAEGPMWRQIRGKGYAYGYKMVVSPQDGLLYMVFARATNVIGAYSEAKQIINDHIDKKVFDTNLIESAKSSLIFELIDQEKTIGHVIGLSLLSYFQNTDYKFNRMLMNQIFQVTIDDLCRVGEKYLLPLFDVNRIRTAILSEPSKADTVVEAFKEFGIHLERYPSLEESFLKC